MPNDPSLRDRRGVATFDLNECSIFVDAPVADVSSALAAARDSDYIESEILGNEVELTEQCFVVFRLAGHEWTQVIARDPMSLMMQPKKRKRGEPDSRMLDEQDAKALSNALKCKALFYANSDTAGAMAYSLYNNGKAIDQLETAEGYEVTKWKSSAKKEKPSDILSHANTVFESLNAFSPGLTFSNFAGCVMHEPGQKMTVVNDEGIFERADFVGT